jgi:imidazolonepropionase-like amidohydrolase
MRTRRTFRTAGGGLAALAPPGALPAVAGAQTIAITGGTVYPVSGPRIERGTVLIQDGRIVAVGADVPIPAGATRVDATGKWVTPGIFHARADAGLNVGSLSGFSESGTQGDVTPAFSPADGFNPDATTIPVARTGGVTTAVLGPSGGFLPGRAILVDLDGERLEDMVVSRGAASSCICALR